MRKKEVYVRLLWLVVVFLSEIFLAAADVIFVDPNDRTSPAPPSDLCPVGWFGDNCNFQCQCTGRNPCRKETGECYRNATCSNFRFGPGCQYVNMLLEVDGRLLKMPYLTDGSKTSCNPDKTSNNLTVPLEVKRQITWFRIHTDMDMSNWKLDVKLGDRPCDGQRVFWLTNTSMDISCSPGRFTKVLHLQGPAVSHICELEISGGRNLAIKQLAVQSSNLTDNKTNSAVYLAHLAVDGGTNRDLGAGSCTHTKPRPEKPWWSLTFNRPEKLTRVKIYNRDAYKSRLTLFTLELYDLRTSNTPFYTYTDTEGGMGTALYDIHLQLASEETTYLKLWVPRSYFIDDTVLSICELEAFGETVCPAANTYGYDCQHKCSCGPKEECSQVTGACAAQCVVFHQDKCSYQCHPNCANKVCQEGDCVSCVLQHCLVCNPGYTGLYCHDECPKGKHGDNCVLDCPKTCKEGTCNATNGHCFACEENLALPLCEPGKGEEEKEKEEDDDVIKAGSDNWLYGVYLLCLLFLLIPLVFCICFCVMKRRARKPETEGMPEQEGVVLTKTVVVDTELLRETGSSVDFAVQEGEE